ncbi:MAG TPA: FAD/NAD(P)-binding protein [Gemmatimonadaceae bacterium]|nr:FAD/NAD(P)-binding protein [Gemmatimonadaceae bacterium]
MSFSASSERAVLVIGAGFSGSMAATHLLRRGAGGPLRVVLVNRSGAMARGIAYGTRSERHVLNVPAGNMSAFPDDPEHFLRYARERDPSVTGGSFVTRRLYGEYLMDVLADAERSAAPGARLERIVGEATGFELAPDGESARVTLADGRTIAADRVILALGNYAPADPPVADRSFYESVRYVRDPWAPGALDAIAPSDRVLLIGTGLTMLDVALDLRTSGARAPMVAISRRGLTPQPHRSPSVAPTYEHRPPGMETGERTARAYLRAVRAHVRTVAERGMDWREVVGALRPITSTLWQGLSVAERARFLRHVRPYWEVHRHRAAPEPAAALRRMMDAGELTVVAGRLLGFRDVGDGVEVFLRRRGASAAEAMRVERVINCTGPESDTRTLRDPLIASLRAAGLLRPDPLGLGLETSESLALLACDGLPSRVLHHVGPFLRATYWESTAVPELRLHAARVAAAVAESLG